MRVIILTLLSFICFISFANADISDCTDIYVGTIKIHKGAGLESVVFLNSPESNSGSYVVLLQTWTSEEKKELLSVLLTAKATGRKLYIETEAADKCSINSPGQELKGLWFR